MNQERWLVGVEHDDDLLQALGRSLCALGYELDEQSWGVGGSQELSSWTVHGPRGKLFVEAETYVGLSVMGEASLIAELQRNFMSAQPANDSLTSDAARPRTLG